MSYSQSWLEDSNSIRGILIELTVKNISTILTTAGAFTIGASYTIKTIGTTNFVSIGAASTAVVTGSVATSVLTITGVTSGALTVGTVISGTGITAGTTISSFGTGVGGTGTYNLSNSMTAGSTTVTAQPTVGTLFTATGIGSGNGTGNLTIEDPIYLSNIGYVTADSSISYLPVISGGVQFTESLPIDGQPTISFGDIAINNSAGELDVWLDYTKYIWANRAIQIYLGDPSWICQNLTEVHTQFEKIFDGVIADVDSIDRNTLNIKIRDKLDRLNVALTDVKLGTNGTWGTGQTNQDTIRPIIFGEVFNFSPLLIDPAPQYAGSAKYMFCKDHSELLIEVRDNGKPLYTHNGTTEILSSGGTVDLPTGIFTTTVPAAGTITMSAQGVKKSINLTTGALVTGTYVNNIANLIALITTQYGKNKLTASELDLVNLQAFSNANTQSVGILVQDSSSVLSVCQQLANSIGAQIFMNRKGKLQLLRIGSPTADTTVNITEDNILNQSLTISNRTTVIASKTINYGKNWTIQENLLTNIYPEDKANFATDYHTKTTVNTTVRDNYKLSEDSIDRIDTLLLIDTEANAESSRLNALYSVPRTIYKFTGTPGLLSLKLGQAVTLTHPRFNLTTATAGQVLTLSPNWLTSTIDVEVLV